MSESLAKFKKEVKTLDKVLTFLIFSIPLFLSISIFISDLFASISGIILIFILIKEKNSNFLNITKKEIKFFLFFYFFILISLIFSNHKEVAFLPSFFYFRYFLLSLALFYLLKKYNFMINILYISFLGTIFLVIFDSFIQLIFGQNLLGYERIGFKDNHTMTFLTSFFDEEKKLGSYLVRFLPMILALLLIKKNSFLKKFDFLIFLLVGSIIYLSSERTALFLYIIITFFYILISEKKIQFLISGIIIFLILTNSNERLKDKYFNYTLQQTKILNIFNSKIKPDYFGEYIYKPQQHGYTLTTRFTIDNYVNYYLSNIPRYYSKEHEDLSFTGYTIFKNNFITGSGIKSFYNECSYLKKKYKELSTSRKNYLICSTHPHNTYIQILSEVGVIGFIIVLFLFFRFLFLNLKIIFLNKNIKNFKVIFFINCTFIINLFPLIPSGNFFNNWLSLMLFFPIGLWLYINNQNQNES